MADFIASCLEGGGVCGGLVAQRDWSATSLGPVSTWPASLTATVANMLHSRQPMLLFWGPDQVQFYNDSFVPSFGQGKHPAAMGQNARECWADAWPVVGAQLEAVTSRGEPTWYENALVPIHRNGRMEEVFWTYSYSPAYDDASKICGVLVIVTEMTGRVLAMRRLETLAALNRMLSTATSYEDVFAVVGQLAERAASDIPFALVCTPDDVQQFGIAADDAAPVVSAVLAGSPAGGLRDVIVAGGPPGCVWPEPVTTMIVGEVGSRGHALALAVSPRLPSDEAYRSFLSQVFEQMSATLTRLDTALERHNIVIALEQANRTKDEFLAMLGHELRNPLAPIVTALELMKARGTEAVSERDVIERQVRHVVRLVDDLLDISKITRGALTLDRQVLDLSTVVAAAIEATTPLIAQRSHTVTVNVAPGAWVLGDESRLVQIVSNLLTNAARYTPEGGAIRVSVTHSGSDVALEVSDNGTGIGAELLPTIFDTFVQGARSADRAEGGLGLGLAIVKNLVALHGGHVVAHSDGPGRGSSFLVTLPVAVADRIRGRAVDANEPAACPRQRILVVDDNQDAADLLGEIVRTRGHDVTVAHDPESALALLDGFRPQIALLDLGLPGMDGYQLAQRLLAIVPTCHVIALTGFGQDSDRQRTATAGFAAHLVKPVKISSLMELLARTHS